MPQGLLDDSIKLNHLLLSQPGDLEDIDIEVNYNILEIYDAVRNGEPYELKNHINTVSIKRSQNVYIDFSKWCQEIVWWGNKKGAYLYQSNIKEDDVKANDVGKLAGHF
jgi:hypothetical protein